jgi:hypothetical protein
MVCTTPPKEDKVGTSSVEAPTAQALVARLGGNALDDNLVDDDPVLLNFNVVESEIICRMSCQMQMCWPDLGKPDCPIWYFRQSRFHTP